MELYFIRHGETDWNTKKLLQGMSDIPLNENGIEVAIETSEALKHIPFDAIYTSPLIRAKKTAELIKGERNIPLIEEYRLREIGFGPYEGLCCSPEGYAIPDKDFLNFFQSPENYLPPQGGESIQLLLKRTAEFLDELIKNPENEEKTFLISCHGATLKALLNSILSVELKDFWKGGVHKNCAVSILSVKNGLCALTQENVIYYDESRSTNYI